MKWHKNIIFIYLLVISTSSINAQLKVTTDGYVGVGGITPNSLLELKNNGWLRLNAPSGTSGILFYRTGTSTPTDIQYGGKIFYDGNSNFLRIGTMENNSYKQSINIRRSDGRIGLGGNPLATNMLTVHGNSYYTGNTFVAGVQSTEKLYVMGAGGYVAYIGAYEPAIYHLYVQGKTFLGLGYDYSDLNSKKNVKKIDGKILSKLMKINGHTYEFKSAAELEPLYNNGTFRSVNDSLLIIPHMPEGQFYGLIAQEVEKEFPELVFTDPKSRTMAINYSGMIPILLEALKEQQKIIDSHENRIGAIERELEILSDKNKQKSTSNDQVMTASADDDVLQTTMLYQNNPNPFNQTTTIRFTIPESVGKAILNVYNVQGVQIKSYQINDRGNSYLHIQASELNPGMYLYTLIVDGRDVDTKRMILTN